MKTRRSYPQWLIHGVEQAEATATASVTPKLPLLRLHTLGGRYADDLYVIPVSAFAAWYSDYRGDGDPAA